MLKNLVRRLVRRFGYDVVRSGGERNMGRNWANECYDAALAWRDTGKKGAHLSVSDFALFCARYAEQSKAQLFQDLLALYVLGMKRDGYFVEFGATDGDGLSNSLLLEKQFGWRGILAEPARSWHGDLLANRDAHICTDCVWSASGETLTFRETAYKELSTIAAFARRDSHANAREALSEYQVNTISLNDLLSQYDAPNDIDFLSIDTEGSELEILRALDFDRYCFRVIVVEHNFTETREPLRDLLCSHGYQQIFEQFSRWDDWYVHSSLAHGTYVLD